MAVYALESWVISAFYAVILIETKRSIFRPLFFLFIVIVFLPGCIWISNVDEF